MIRGGESYFVVPDRCDIWIDRRTVPGETKEDVKREVEGFLGPIKGSRPEFQYESFRYIFRKEATWNVYGEAKNERNYR
jgi:acetylornithine deacetylase/succinyl-diaminopimelate desuccinylase-like protein